ncbi:stimulated by retinoic acid gene 6 protein-like isoform X1 [Exaiptasia diaphana]|uniref:Uncharacterized protein n=1 Tax=Exaiptasia diaphana TaxID=2652724 RepID=A0A913WYU4_EXADI|nr:stimulated by retinoic acid gene 6 protein-like isoform X1 [Exaiptasia diaphana]
MSEKCLVDGYSYTVGMLVCAMLIMVVLSFMKKRVRLRPDLWNGRPGLPIPVNFLGKERNRLIIVLAFGATTSSFFVIFYESFLNISDFAIVKNIPNTPYGKAFKGVLATTIYGIINYPYFACLNAEYSLIGYIMGLLYTLIRCTVHLVIYLGCSLQTQQDVSMYTTSRTL